MARKVFYSFRYVPDNWRTSQVRNAGVLEGNHPVSDNAWETITSGGDPAIQAWIDGQLAGRSCSVVLIGSRTAGRKWINYEIEKTWNDRKGLLGIHIHNLKDSSGYQSAKGSNPFAGFAIGAAKTPMTSVVKTYDPPYNTSTDVYDYIKRNLETWVEEAIAIRGRY
jgi:hypothetical protein